MQNTHLRSAVWAIVAGYVVCCCVCTAAAAEESSTGNSDLERFLPNNGNSAYDASGLLREWPAGGPEQLWRVEIGWGKSAIVEADGRAFTATETDEKQWGICLDPQTGKTLWKRLLYPKGNRHFARGPVTSPVVDGERVYFIPYAILGKDVWEMRCPIICFEADGTELWRVEEKVWATEASTPLVVGDTLYVGADNPQRAVLAALDKMSGAVQWIAAAESDKKRELGAPASLTYQVVDGVPQIVVGTYGTRELLGVHAETGMIMWRYPYPAEIIIGLVSTPVAVGSRLFVAGGEGRGKMFSACLEMTAESGRITYEELYVDTELQTNNYNTVAIYEDAVFGFGGLGKKGFLHCTDFGDGRLLWKEESDDWSKDQQLVIADDLLFTITKNEEVVIAEASRKSYRELGRFSLGMELGRPQQPTIANGRMYIRGNTTAACYQIGE